MVLPKYHKGRLFDNKTKLIHISKSDLNFLVQNKNPFKGMMNSSFPGNQQGDINAFNGNVPLNVPAQNLPRTQNNPQYNPVFPQLTDNQGTNLSFDSLKNGLGLYLSFLSYEYKDSKDMNNSNKVPGNINIQTVNVESILSIHFSNNFCIQIDIENNLNMIIKILDESIEKGNNRINADSELDDIISFKKLDNFFFALEWNNLNIIFTPKKGKKSYEFRFNFIINSKSFEVTLETSETEEYSTFLEILNLFLENSPESAFKYKDNLYNMVKELLKYPNEDIQGECSKILIWITEGLTKVDQNLLHQSAKVYIVNIITQMKKEKGFSVIVELITSVKEIIEKAKVFLTTPEINEISENVLEVFDNVEKARIALMEEKEKTEKEIEEDKKTGANKIYSDDEDDGSEEEIIDDIKDQIQELEEVQTSFSDFFGTLFKTHKELSLELVGKLFKSYIPKYLDTKSSPFEKKIAILIIDDCAEFLEQTLLSTDWINIKNILVQFVDHSDYTLRNAAVYGLGVFSQHTFNGFADMANDILVALKKSLEFPPDAKKKDKDNMKFSKDNSVSALGKIIKYHRNEVQGLQELAQYWLDNMPITTDDEEGVIMNKFLMELLETDPKLVVGENYKNMGHICAILVKGLDTNFCDDETNTKIKELIKKIKGNNEMKNIISSYFETMKEGKNKNKMKRIFSSDN